MHWWLNEGPWNWAAMTIGMVAFWGLVAWAFVTAVGSPDRSERATRRSREQMLAERFAAGEIDSDEYHQRLDALRSAKVTAR